MMGDVGAITLGGRIAAESGLMLSLRRQASLQYRIEGLGVLICSSHMALSITLSARHELAQVVVQIRLRQ